MFYLVFLDRGVWAPGVTFGLGPDGSLFLTPTQPPLLLAFLTIIASPSFHLEPLPDSPDLSLEFQSLSRTCSDTSISFPFYTEIHPYRSCRHQHRALKVLAHFRRPNMHISNQNTQARFYDHVQIPIRVLGCRVNDGSNPKHLHLRIFWLPVWAAQGSLPAYMSV